MILRIFSKVGICVALILPPTNLQYGFCILCILNNHALVRNVRRSHFPLGKRNLMATHRLPDTVKPNYT